MKILDEIIEAAEKPQPLEIPPGHVAFDVPIVWPLGRDIPTSHYVALAAANADKLARALLVAREALDVAMTSSEGVQQHCEIARNQIERILCQHNDKDTGAHPYCLQCGSTLCRCPKCTLADRVRAKFSRAFGGDHD